MAELPSEEREALIQLNYQKLCQASDAYSRVMRDYSHLRHMVVHAEAVWFQVQAEVAFSLNHANLGTNVPLMSPDEFLRARDKSVEELNTIVQKERILLREKEAAQKNEV